MKGMLSLDSDTRARKALIMILYDRSRVYGTEHQSVNRLAMLIRTLTVAEGRLIHQIHGRMICRKAVVDRRKGGE